MISLKEQSTRLGQEPVPRLLASLTIPAMVGMLVMSLHSVIDTIYISRGVGTVGVAAVAISFPVMMFFLALGGALGIGGGSVISRALGAGDLEKADRTFGNVLTMILGVSVGGAFLGRLFLVPMLDLFGATPTIMPHACEYLGIILYGTVVFTFSFSVNNIVRAEGNARVAMLTMILSSLLNIALTPLFMFVMNLGMRGAAYGTVVAQGLTALYLLVYFLGGKSSLTIRLPYLPLHVNLVREILAIGVSAFARQGSASVMLVVANNLLVFYGGDLAVATLGIIHRVMMFTLMPILGVVQGMLPLVGYNYGSGQSDRVAASILLAMKVATIISFGAFALVMSVPDLLMRIFTDDPQMMAMGRQALRLVFALSMTVGIQMVTAGLFQAIGRAKAALVMSLTRQVLFLIPLLLVLPLRFELMGVWLAFPTAELLSFALSLALLGRYRHLFLGQGKQKKQPTESGSYALEQGAAGGAYRKTSL